MIACGVGFLITTLTAGTGQTHFPVLSKGLITDAIIGLTQCKLIYYVFLYILTSSSAVMNYDSTRIDLLGPSPQVAGS